MANRFWVGGTGRWNTTTTHWSATTGGGAGASVPTVSDAVFFDGNSGGGTVTVNGDNTGNDAKCASIDTTGFTGTLDFPFTPVTASQIEVRGSITIGSGTTFSGSGAQGFSLTATTGGPYTLTSNGVHFNELTINATAGITLQLADDLSIFSITLTQGTFNANNKNITTHQVTSSGTFTRVLTMGSGLWTLSTSSISWDTVNTTGLTFNANTSTVKFVLGISSVVSFFGGDVTFNNLTFIGPTSGSANVNWSGAHTINLLEIDGDVTGGFEINFPTANTQTISNILFTGIYGNNIIFDVGSAGTSNISCSGAVTVNWCTIKNNKTSGSAIFDARNSIDGGGNTGWRFINPGQQMMGMF